MIGRSENPVEAARGFAKSFKINLGI